MKARRRVTRKARAGSLIAVALAWGCASSGAGDEAGAPDATGECVVGIVVSEGLPIAPRTLIQVEEGPPVELLGAFAGNVRRLAGTVVRACGPGRTPEGALEVTGVTLLEVDGMPAALGTLRSVVSGWALEPFDGRAPILLTGVPEGLRSAEDEVVWVAGPTAENALAVRSFAVLEGWR